MHALVLGVYVDCSHPAAVATRALSDIVNNAASGASGLQELQQRVTALQQILKSSTADELKQAVAGMQSVLDANAQQHVRKWSPHPKCRSPTTLVAAGPRRRFFWLLLSSYRCSSPIPTLLPCTTCSGCQGRQRHSPACSSEGSC